MNRRRREILNALQPVAEVALQRGKPQGDVPGLAFRPRAENSAAELMIYGRIGGGGFFDEGIGAADVAALLREAGAGPIDVRINSGGGDVFDGIAIHSLLARHPGTVTVYIDGLAASAASFIALAGHRIVSARNAFMMIHDGMTGTYGNADTHRASADLLDKVSANIADMYAERAGEDVEHWRNLMTVNGEDGTWFTGQEALEAGLVDELTEVPDDSAVLSRLQGWDNVLKKAPERVRNVLAELDDPTDGLPDWDGTVTPLAEPETPAEEPEEQPPAESEHVDDDYQHAMSMALWMITNGRTARMGAA
jgi:ATP-dependent protease ClpP protease subunit